MTQGPSAASEARYAMHVGHPKTAYPCVQRCKYMSIIATYLTEKPGDVGPKSKAKSLHGLQPILNEPICILLRLLPILL
jgi:hypothetical protein